MPAEFVVVLTTWPAGRDATPFAETLVRERLAACVNVLPEMQSVYSWKGNIEREREHQVVMKTRVARVEELRARVVALHPYEVPEFIVLAVEGGGEPYLRWIRENTE